MDEELILTERPSRKPTHPGEVLREDVLPVLGESVSGFARRIGMSRQTVHAILTCKRPVTTEAALRIGKVVGNGARVWINMQTEYDLWRTEIVMHDELLALAA